MVLVVPGGQGLFSLVQEAFHHKFDNGNRLRLTNQIHDVFRDWKWLANNISSRPTRIAELAPTNPPHISGACDAALTGMGGFFLAPTQGKTKACVWRAPFPPHIQSKLVTYTNIPGTITNSDSELAGTLAHNDIICQSLDARENVVHTFSDNTPAVCWCRKLSTTATGPVAHLLRLQVIHQRHHQCLAMFDHIAGTNNLLADICSRAWHLTDDQLLTLFNSRYPQDAPW